MSKDDDARLSALRKWRDDARNPGAPGLTNAVLATIVSSGGSTAAEIIKHLPQHWQRFADEIAAVLAGSAPNGAPNGVPRADAPPLPPSPSSSARAHGLDALTFARYNFVASDHPVAQVTPTPSGAGGVGFAWPTYQGAPVVIYRVVSSDEYVPYSPDDADEIAVTTQLTTVDGRPFTAAVRHVQVWCHVGPTPAAAASTQPVLHARGAVVAPVQDVRLNEDAGKVVGYWKVLKGAARVQVHRIPVELADRVIRKQTPQAEYRRFATEDNLNGFIDTTAEPGKRYLYQMWVEAETDDGAQLSTPVAASVSVSAVLAPVTDLQIYPRGSDGFDIAWTTPPGSEVRIYRTQTEPDRAALRETFDDATPLPLVGLPDGARLDHPFQSLADGRTVMADVSWPRDWTRAYFTPVTVLGEQVRLGPSAPAVRVLPVVEPKIVERTHQQVVTFGWPEGATSVFAFVGDQRHSLAAARAGRSFEIAREQYVREGGLHLTDVLPPQGCRIHLLPIAYTQGVPVEGPPVAVDYRGLVTLRYHLTHHRGGMVTIHVLARYNVPWRIPFALVHNPRRFPLAVHDGAVIPVSASGAGAEGGQRFSAARLGKHAGEVSWTASVEGRSGYIRVFVDLGDQPHGPAVALIDPSVAQLRLGGGAPR